MAGTSEKEKAEASRADSVHIEEKSAPSKPMTPEERKAERLRQAQEQVEQQKKEQERKKIEKEQNDRRYRRKLIVPIVVLIFCAIASITMALSGYDSTKMLIVLLCVLVVSWILGSLLYYMYEKFARQNEAKALDEGEVINKGSVSQNDVTGEVHG